jgi:diaminohydroxyphosphoribosylaminopyrimidine deaminase/5-amino-6-(5-phosphoribosylamino)uracil reductase
VTALLCEGGGHLGSKLLAEGLVDRLYLVQSPIWLGDEGARAFEGIPSLALPDAPRWTVVERRALGDDTLLTVDRTICLPAS